MKHPDTWRPWVVYIVECSDGTYYTGISNNLSKRLLTHNSGKGAKYTRGRLPVALMWFKSCENKSEASKLEYKIKKLSKKAKIKLITNG
jgi:putative endonuclease